MLQFELFGMDRIPVTAGDVIGVTNDADVGPVAVSYTTGPTRILRRPISHRHDRHTAGQFSSVDIDALFRLSASGSVV